MKIRMASLTVRLHQFAAGDGLVLDFSVAEQALDFVFGDMIAMHELSVVIFLDLLKFRMTMIATDLRHRPIPGDHVAVTIFAGNVTVDHHSMVVDHLPYAGGVLDRGLVTLAARVKRGILAGVLEMTQKTRGLRHLDMVALNNLRMATGTAQLLVAAQIA